MIFGASVSNVGKSTVSPQACQVGALVARAVEAGAAAASSASSAMGRSTSRRILGNNRCMIVSLRAVNRGQEGCEQRLYSVAVPAGGLERRRLPNPITKSHAL